MNRTWTYKNISININDDGLFVFTFNNKDYKHKSLEDAKECADKLTKDYYNFSMKDYNSMLSKLNKREQDFVNTICKELACHYMNPYCELGVNVDFNFNFSKFEE